MTTKDKQYIAVYQEGDPREGLKTKITQFKNAKEFNQWALSNAEVQDYSYEFKVEWSGYVDERCLT